MESEGTIWSKFPNGRKATNKKRKSKEIKIKEGRNKYSCNGPTTINSESYGLIFS